MKDQTLHEKHNCSIVEECEFQLLPVNFGDCYSQIYNTNQQHPDEVQDLMVIKQKLQYILSVFQQELRKVEQLYQAKINKLLEIIKQKQSQIKSHQTELQCYRNMKISDRKEINEVDYKLGKTDQIEWNKTKEVKTNLLTIQPKKKIINIGQYYKNSFIRTHKQEKFFFQHDEPATLGFKKQLSRTTFAESYIVDPSESSKFPPRQFLQAKLFNTMRSSQILRSDKMF